MDWNTDEALRYYRHIFDVIRFVDPIKKETVLCGDPISPVPLHSCYDFWERNHACENCISMRTLNEQKQYSKIEYLNNRIYVIMTVPIKNADNDLCVLELVKDVTDLEIISYLDAKAEKQITKLNQLAVVDELTQIYNRRYLNEKLPTILDNVATNNPLLVALLDLDYFKSINDNLGHLAGDSVLKDMAQLLKTITNDYSGWVARYGGEEFLIVIPTRGEAENTQILEHIRAYISNYSFKFEDKHIQLTASLGGACVTTALPLSCLLASIDKQLYLAKEHGRNKVCMTVCS